MWPGDRDLTSLVWDSCDQTREWSNQPQVEKPGELLTDEQRLLRARLIYEEAMETLEGLGCEVYTDLLSKQVEIRIYKDMDLEKTIDGCCDLRYVSTGTLVALNIPDNPHDDAVCRANEAKFIDGKPVPHPNIPGKYGKPEGWKPPNHGEVMKEYMESV